MESVLTYCKDKKIPLRHSCIHMLTNLVMFGNFTGMFYNPYDNPHKINVLQLIIELCNRMTIQDIMRVLHIASKKSYNEYYVAIVIAIIHGRDPTAAAKMAEKNITHVSTMIALVNVIRSKLLERCSLGTAMKNVLGKKISKMSLDELLQYYNRNPHDIKDLLRLCHPVPRSHQQSMLFKKFLKTPPLLTRHKWPPYKSYLRNSINLRTHPLTTKSDKCSLNMLLRNHPKTSMIQINSNEDFINKMLQLPFEHMTTNLPKILKKPLRYKSFKKILQKFILEKQHCCPYHIMGFYYYLLHRISVSQITHDIKLLLNAVYDCTAINHQSSKRKPLIAFMPNKLFEHSIQLMDDYGATIQLSLKDVCAIHSLALKARFPKSRIITYGSDQITPLNINRDMSYAAIRDQFTFATASLSSGNINNFITQPYQYATEEERRDGLVIITAHVHLKHEGNGQLKTTVQNQINRTTCPIFINDILPDHHDFCINLDDNLHVGQGFHMKIIDYMHDVISRNFNVKKEIQHIISTLDR